MQDLNLQKIYVLKILAIPWEEEGEWFKDPSGQRIRHLSRLAQWSVAPRVLKIKTAFRLSYHNVEGMGR